MVNEYQRLKREQLKEKSLTYLGGKKCSKCGDESLPICCYDFHHKNNKSIEISKMFNNSSWQEIRIELDKCVILCANCHRIVHVSEVW